LGRVQAEEQTDLWVVLLHLALFRLLAVVTVLLTQLLQLVALAVQAVERDQMEGWPEEVEIRQAPHQAKVITAAHLTPAERLMAVVVVVVQPELAQTVLPEQVGQVERVQHHQLQDLL
jgi:hypothetical protein